MITNSQMMMTSRSLQSKKSVQEITCWLKILDWISKADSSAGHGRPCSTSIDTATQPNDQMSASSPGAPPNCQEFPAGVGSVC